MVPFGWRRDPSKKAVQAKPVVLLKTADPSITRRLHSCLTNKLLRSPWDMFIRSKISHNSMLMTLTSRCTGMNVELIRVDVSSPEGVVVAVLRRQSGGGDRRRVGPRRCVRDGLRRGDGRAAGHFGHCE